MGRNLPISFKGFFCLLEKKETLRDMHSLERGSPLIIKVCDMIIDGNKSENAVSMALLKEMRFLI